jgi:hypothetical protein
LFFQFPIKGGWNINCGTDRILFHNDHYFTYAHCFCGLPATPESLRSTVPGQR